MKKYSSKEDIEEKGSVLEEPERMICDISEAITAEELLARLAPKIKAMFDESAVFTTCDG